MKGSYRQQGRWLRLLLAIFGAILVSAPAPAEDADSQFWMQMTFHTRLRNRVRLFLEAQPRWGEGYGRTTLFIIRPAVGYQVQPNLSLWLGYGWTPAFTPEFNSEDRFFQQVLLEDRYPGFEMINRTRLEERNIAGAGDTSVRLRHLVRLSKPLDSQKRWSVIFSNELFWNLNTTRSGPEAGFDQNRVYFGFGYNTTRQMRVELGYLANFLNPPRGRPDRRLDALALTLNFNY